MLDLLHLGVMVYCSAEMRYLCTWQVLCWLWMCGDS